MEAAGKPIANTKVNVLKPYLERDIGQATHMNIKKPNGETVAVTLVAEAEVEKK